MDELSRNELNRMVNDAVSNVGAENIAQLLASIKHKTHEAKYLGECESMQEAERHIISCPECLSNMPPLEIFWKMTHHAKDVQCETPFHSKDRYLVN